MLPGIGFSLQAQYDRPIEQVIALLRQAGFCAVSPAWSPELDLEALADCVHSHGMTFQSLHAPYRGIPQLWEPDLPQSAEVLERMLHCIDVCAAYQIPVLVIHSWQGLIYTFPETPLDFRVFDQIVQYAGRKGVSIAFENLEGEEYLQALLTRYRSLPHVGFCWDSGHAHCYPHKLDFLKEFGDRLIMTHLNDNRGCRDPEGVPRAIDDLHFLPYDGNVDWEENLRRLQTAPRQAILNFEIKLRSKSEAPEDLPYTRLTLEEFVARCGRHARKLAAQYDTSQDHPYNGWPAQPL